MTYYARLSCFPRGEHEPAPDHPHHIATAICNPSLPSSPGPTARFFDPFHWLRRAGSVPGVADFNLHGRFRATGTLSGGRCRARAGGGRKTSCVSWRLDYRVLEVTELFPWQTLYQPRCRWA